MADGNEGLREWQSLPGGVESLAGEGNALELDSGDGCTSL